MAVKRMRAAVALWLVLAAAAPPESAAAEEADLRLAVPAKLAALGLPVHLLPRFRFKTRIRVEAVAHDAPADLVLEAGGAGTAVFRGTDGTTWRLRIVPGAPEEAAAFLDWLQSEPGRMAVAAFEVDGAAPFLPGEAPVETVAAPVIEGDAVAGAALALAHCGRCHVVDARNPFGGIGSTPSFAAMRGADDWQPRFEAFWSLNPHPAFTQIDGVTAPFPPDRPPAIAPVELTLEETRAITAFVATLAPKDLGAQVEAR